MARTTKVIGFSLPPEVNTKLEKLIKSRHKTRSEFIREMIDVYTDSISTVHTTTHLESKELNVGEASLAKLLKAYYDIRTNQDIDTVIVGLGLITKNGKVLIGKRGALDKNIRNLTWVFPGGKLETLNFTKDVTERVKIETGLEVKVGKLIHARVHPDNLTKSVNIVALYFHCEVVGGAEKPGGRKSSVPLVQLRWVKPTDVVRYFTTSTSDEVMRFLAGIELTAK